MGFGYPEYGKLRKLLLHSPGDELGLINPATFGRFLFEDAIDAQQFRKEHENFTEAARSEGVEVLFLSRVLQKKPIELKLVRRLPNLAYVRDTAVVMPSGYIRMRMKNVVRRPEPRIVEEALRELGLRKQMSVESPATMEGGDLIFLDTDTLLLGVGNRTNRWALRGLCKKMTEFRLRRLVVVPLPPCVIHLDGTMMIVDSDLAVFHKRSLTNAATVFEEGVLRCKVHLHEFLKKERMVTVEVTDCEREKRATNLLTLGPRKVIGYEGNRRFRRALEEEGVDFIEVDGSELVRGGGGPRCMTAPVLRDWA